MNYLSILIRTFDVLLDVSALYLVTFFSVIIFSLSIKREIETYSCPNLLICLF